MEQVSTEKLAQVPLFSYVPVEALRHLASLARAARFGANEDVIVEGRPSDALYILEEGSAAVLKNDHQMVALLGPGDHCGEMSLLDGQAASASVRTREACRVWVISREDFQALLAPGSHHAVDFYRGIVNVLCERLRAANESMSSLLSAI